MSGIRFNTPASAGRCAPFQLIKAAATLTGFSQKFLREGCKAGTIPHVMVGCRYMINVPLFLRQLGVPEEGDPDARKEKKALPMLRTSNRAEGSE